MTPEVQGEEFRSLDDISQRILDFDFNDDGADFSFADRLARDNGWSRDFAARVIAEYKRFLVLYVKTKHPVTPSDQVDQAWHLHLVYSHSYWDDLCGEIVGRPLHHGPTRGGDHEAYKFENWYQRTLDSYSETFGHPPPADIWPAAEIRFGEDLYFRRVNLERNLVVALRPKIVDATLKVLAGLTALVAAFVFFKYV